MKFIGLGCNASEINGCQKEIIDVNHDYAIRWYLHIAHFRMFYHSDVFIVGTKALFSSAGT